MPVSPREVKAWQGFCLTAVARCQARGDELMGLGHRGRASWLYLGVQVFGQLGASTVACQSYVGVLEDWTEAGEDFLIAHMCRYMAGSIGEPEHYYVMVLGKIAEEFPQDAGDPGDEQPVPMGTDWIDQVLIGAATSLLEKLAGHARGCGCQSCRATALQAERWWQETTKDPR